MTLDAVIPKELLQRISPELHPALMESISKYCQAVEKHASERMNAILESLSTKFAESAHKALLETAEKKVDSVPMTALKQIAATLEALGLPMTEETKKLQRQLKEYDDKLKKEIKERNKIEAALLDAEKENRILQLTQGFSPSIVQKALEWGKTQDITEINSKNLEDFINGNAAYEPHRDFELTDNVTDVLDRANGNRAMGGLGITKNVPALESVGAKDISHAKSMFEMLASGTAKVNPGQSPSISDEALLESENLDSVLSDESGASNDDIRNTLNLLKNFSTKWG